MIEWARPYTWIVYALLITGLIVLVIVARMTAISPQLRRWLLFVPRCGVLGTLVLVLFNPVRRHEQGLPDKPALVHYLVDGSRSMSLDRPRARAAQVQSAIEQSESRLNARPDRPRVQWFRFGKLLASASETSQLLPRDDSSQLGQALTDLTSRFSRDLPRGIVVFSDGTVDDASQLGEVAAAYHGLGIPVHVYPVGDNRVKGDVSIRDLVLPPRVEPGTKATIHGVVRGQGFSGQRAVVQVRSLDRAELPPLAQLPVTLDDEPRPFELVVEANPDHGELALEVTSFPDEISERNNRVPFRLVQAPRKLRVLYMEGTPGEEYRFIRDALQEDKDIECVSMVADQQYVQRPRLVRIGDPFRGYPATREELLGYDCVICSDISRGAFTREQLDWTVELVAKRGGGFAMVGGITSFGAGGWDSTSWDQLIPIDMAGGTIGQGWLYHSFHVQVPDDPQVIQHPIWRIVDDPEENRRVIERMPPFYGTNFMQRLKPAATVLAVTATPIPHAGVMPIFAAQPYGRGRTFAFAPDSTADWGRDFERQWGERGDNRYFRRFWRNIVRWLAENSQAGVKRVRAESDRVVYRLGQPVEIVAEAFDQELRPTTRYELSARLAPDSDEGDGVQRSVNRVEGDAGDRALAKTAESSWSSPLSVTPDGQRYTVTLDSEQLVGGLDLNESDSAVLLTRRLVVVATEQGQEVGRAMVPIQLLPDSREFDRPAATPATLEQLAAATGGQVLRSPGELADLVGALPATKGDMIISRSPLWDHPLVWSTILGLLSIEWILRRRNG